MQIKEKIKDHRLMLCFIVLSYVIKIFSLIWKIKENR